MGYEIGLEDANSGNVICRPYLSVAAFHKTEYTINKIIAVNDGYVNRDKIVKVDLSESLLDSSNSYPFQTDTQYDFYDGSNRQTFYVDDAEEINGNTVISVYGREKELSKFFVNLTANVNLDDYTFIYSENLQRAEIENCVTSEFAIKNVTSNSFKVFIQENPLTAIKIQVNYRVKGFTEWDVVHSNSIPVEISNLQSKTEYEVKYLIHCPDGAISMFSDIQIVKTR